MGALLSPTSDNFVQKTLGAQLLAGATTVTLNNTTNIPNLPGAFIVDRIDTNSVETPSTREVITYTGVSGSTLTGLARNADGSGSDQAHAINAIVEFGPDVLWAQSVYDAITKVVVASTGLLDTTKVVDLATAQTLTTKTLTSPTVNTPTIGTSIIVNDVYNMGTTLTGATTIDPVNGDRQGGTMTGNISITLTAPASNKKRTLTLYLLEDATGGRTITFTTTVTWQDAITPIWTTTASKLNVAVLYYDGASWFGMGAKFA